MTAPGIPTHLIILETTDAPIRGKKHGKRGKSSPRRVFSLDNGKGRDSPTAGGGPVVGRSRAFPHGPRVPLSRPPRGVYLKKMRKKMFTRQTKNDMM